MCIKACVVCMRGGVALMASIVAIVCLVCRYPQRLAWRRRVNLDVAARGCVVVWAAAWCVWRERLGGFGRGAPPPMAERPPCAGAGGKPPVKPSYPTEHPYKIILHTIPRNFFPNSRRVASNFPPLLFLACSGCCGGVMEGGDGWVYTGRTTVPLVALFG